MDGRKEIEMKKYIILIFTFLIAIGIIVGFDVITRIQVWKNGIAAYNEENYNETYEKLESVSKDIDMKTYTGEDIEILKYSDNVSLILEDIEFLGDCYNLHFVSKGYSEYEYGQILSYENQIDTEIETSEGIFILAIKGVDPIYDNERRYTYYLYPKENIDMKAISNIEMKLKIDNIMLINYYRK